jgi:hypothetical protein
MKELNGIYAILVSMPIWSIVLVFYLLTLFVVDAGREIFEGFSYNVSFAAKYADVGLLVAILIGATILKRIPGFDSFLGAEIFQIICVAISLLISLFMISSEVLMRQKHISRQIVDIYHNILIMPLFVFLFLTLVPVIYLHGSNVERLTTLFFLLLWVVLMICDIKAGRLEQREWLVKHGYGVILKN